MPFTIARGCKSEGTKEGTRASDSRGAGCGKGSSNLQERFFFFSSRRRHTRLQGDWSSDVCSSDLASGGAGAQPNPQDDPNNVWNAYFAQSTNGGGSFTVAKASDHVIHHGPLCIDGLDRKSVV